MKKFLVNVKFYFNLVSIILSAYIKLVLHKYSWQDYVTDSGKILNLVKKIGTKVLILSEENLKCVSAPVVFVSNHMSSLETFIFGYILGRYHKISFVVKKSLLYYPFFGHILNFLKPIVVSRKNAISDFKIVIKKFKNLIEEKTSIVIFPQATRSLNIDEKQFSSLGVKLAKIYNIPIIPICIKTDFLSLGKVVRDIGKVNPEKDVYIKIFPPIYPQQITKNTNSQIVNNLKSFLAKIS